MYIIRAHRQAFEHLEAGGPSIACNLGSGKGVSVLEVIDSVGSAMGVKVPYRLFERRPVDAVTPIYIRAQKLLDWTPNHDLASIIHSAVEWHKILGNL